jgi:hypothetical protein
MSPLWPEEVNLSNDACQPMGLAEAICSACGFGAFLQDFHRRCVELTKFDDKLMGGSKLGQCPVANAMGIRSSESRTLSGNQSLLTVSGVEPTQIVVNESPLRFGKSPTGE